MATVGDGFLEILHQAVGGGREITVCELCNCVVFESDNYLDQLQELDAFLKRYRLIMRPEITVGDADEVRLLVYGVDSVSFSGRLFEILGQGELVNVEYKSTAFVSVRDVRENSLPPDQCLSDGVLHSLLKTLCGFLNKDGGEVFVGVEQNHALCGIEMDYMALPVGGQDFDGWSNRLLDQIRSKFHESRIVSNYIDIDVEVINNVPVSRINVRPRKRLSFLKGSDGAYRCYVRQNVRTEEIKLEDLPDFIEARRLREEGLQTAASNSRCNTQAGVA